MTSDSVFPLEETNGAALEKQTTSQEAATPDAMQECLDLIRSSHVEVMHELERRKKNLENEKVSRDETFNPYLAGRKCMLCQADRPAEDVDDAEDDDEAERMTNPLRLELRQMPFWMCDSCTKMVEEEGRQQRTAQPPVTPLRTATLSKSVSSPVTAPARGGGKDAALCLCSPCCERRTVEAECFLHKQNFEIWWYQLSKAICELFLDEGIIEGNRHSELQDAVDKLLQADPLMTFKRLDNILNDFVVQLKISILTRLPSGVKGDEESVTFLQYFLQVWEKWTTATVRSHGFLDSIDWELLGEVHLSWQLFAGHVFQASIFADPVIQSTLDIISEQTPLGDDLQRQFDAFSDEMDFSRKLSPRFNNLHDQLLQAVNAHYAASQTEYQPLETKLASVTKAKLAAPCVKESTARLNKFLEHPSWRDTFPPPNLKLDPALEARLDNLKPPEADSGADMTEEEEQLVQDLVVKAMMEYFTYEEFVTFVSHDLSDPSDVEKKMYAKFRSAIERRRREKEGSGSSETDPTSSSGTDSDSGRAVDQGDGIEQTTQTPPTASSQPPSSNLSSITQDEQVQPVLISLSDSPAKKKASPPRKSAVLKKALDKTKKGVVATPRRWTPLNERPEFNPSASLSLGELEKNFTVLTATDVLERNKAQVAALDAELLALHPLTKSETPSTAPSTPQSPTTESQNLLPGLSAKIGETRAGKYVTLTSKEALLTVAELTEMLPKKKVGLEAAAFAGLQTSKLKDFAALITARKSEQHKQDCPMGKQPPWSGSELQRQLAADSADFSFQQLWAVMQSDLLQKELTSSEPPAIFLPDDEAMQPFPLFPPFVDPTSSKVVRGGDTADAVCNVQDNSFPGYRQQLPGRGSLPAAASLSRERLVSGSGSNNSNNVPSNNNTVETESDECSSSECSGSAPPHKRGSDCCCCEMFGPAVASGSSSAIRDRLRQKINRKLNARDELGGGDGPGTTPPNLGVMPIDALVEYVEGTQRGQAKKKSRRKKKTEEALEKENTAVKPQPNIRPSPARDSKSPSKTSTERTEAEDTAKPSLDTLRIASDSTPAPPDIVRRKPVAAEKPPPNSVRTPPDGDTVMNPRNATSVPIFYTHPPMSTAKREMTPGDGSKVETRRVTTIPIRHGPLPGVATGMRETTPGDGSKVETRRVTTIPIRHGPLPGVATGMRETPAPVATASVARPPTAPQRATSNPPEEVPVRAALPECTGAKRTRSFGTAPVVKPSPPPLLRSRSPAPPSQPLESPNLSRSADETGRKKVKKKNKTPANTSTKGIDRVFLPRAEKDLTTQEMDEGEKEIEAFKRFCQDSPLPHSRPKIQLNCNFRELFAKKR